MTVKSIILKPLKEKKILQNEDDASFYKRYFKLKEDVFNAYIDVIPKIAEAFPGHTIIVRPHPSENYNAWSEAAKDAQNVEIVHEGSVHPWLMASDVVVHHFCTTALEACASDTPAIAYRPYKDDKIETSLVYKGSVPAETPDALIRELKAIIDNNDTSKLDTIRSEQRNMLNEYIENLVGSFAYEETLKALDQHAVVTNEDINMTRVFARKLRTRMGDTYRFLKRGMKPYEKNYMDHKFPSFSEAELRSMIDDAGESIPDLKNVHIKKIDPFCYVITGK